MVEFGVIVGTTRGEGLHANENTSDKKANISKNIDFFLVGLG